MPKITDTKFTLSLHAGETLKVIRADAVSPRAQSRAHLTLETPGGDTIADVDLTDEERQRVVAVLADDDTPTDAEGERATALDLLHEAYVSAGDALPYCDDLRALLRRVGYEGPTDEHHTAPAPT